MKHPPKWVADALRQSAGPKWIIRRLLDSQELADLWEELPAAWRERVGALPECLAFIRPSERHKPMPWTAENRPDDQAAHAARVARAACELNKELRTFAPLARLRLHQLLPAEELEGTAAAVAVATLMEDLGADPAQARRLFAQLLAMTLAAVPVAAHGDCLLRRLETMAKSYTPKRSALVGRPTKGAAWRTYLIRSCDALAGRAKWPRIGTRRAFVAGLVNALDPAAACDAKAVKESLRPRRGLSGDTNPR